MSVTVTMRRASDDLTRSFEYNDDGASAAFAWRADNLGRLWQNCALSCNCNRAALFAKAANEPDPELECGMGAFVVYVSGAGGIIYSEFTP